MSLVEPANYGGNVKRNDTEWTDERNALLTELWAAGQSGSQIGKLFGVSRSAVIGKVHRLGLPGRERKAVVRTRIPRLNSRAAKIKLGPPVRFTKQMAEVIHIAPGEACKVPFLDVGRRQCRYPLWGEGYTPLEQKFCCGAVTPKSATYCGYHDRVCNWKEANLRPLTFTGGYGR